MGYKTKDPKEVSDLQKQGYNVIGITQPVETIRTVINGIEKIITNVIPGLVYEFNFEKEVLKEDESTNTTLETATAFNVSEIKTEKEEKIKEPPKKEVVLQKKRGRPFGSKGKK